MTKKVFELAREMGVSSKDLIGKAESLGIDVKNHMSALSDADIDKIKSGAGKPAAVSGSRWSTRKCWPEGKRPRRRVRRIQLR